MILVDSIRDNPLTRWLPLAFGALLAVLLVGYAIGGRGFAHHTGIHPIFLSEILVVIAIVSLAAGIRSRQTGLMTLLLVFVAFAAIHTAFAIGTHGFDALRDAVIWVYGIVALAVALLLRQEHLPRIVMAYRWLVPAILIWTPVASLIRRIYQEHVPGLPFADVGIVYFKAGDFAVHLTAIAGFVILGLMSKRLALPSWRWQVPLWVLWAIAVFVVLNSRAAMLTILAGVLFAQILYVLRPPEGIRAFAPLVLPWVMIVVVLAASSATGFQYETATGDVRIDGRYVLNGIASAVGITFIGDPSAAPASNDVVIRDNSEAEDGQITASTPDFDRTSQRQLNTREWRLEWWREIAGYTVRGDYFWTGKGFGVNLADSDGFQVNADPPLRSPHNVHMTFLARMGVPGLLAWFVLQAAFAVSVFRVFMRQSEAGTNKWIRPMSGLVLVFWLAVMVNSSFDVYLEGPQGGIWFWSVFGLGLALVGFAQREIAESRKRIWT